MRFHDIEKGKTYVLQLCQKEDGIRYSKFLEVGMELDSNCVFVTKKMDYEFLSSDKGKSLEDYVPLEDGRSFGFGGHGEWFTEAEMKSMRAYDLGQSTTVKWDTEHAPSFAPK